MKKTRDKKKSGATITAAPNQKQPNNIKKNIGVSHLLIDGRPNRPVSDFHPMQLSAIIYNSKRIFFRKSAKNLPNQIKCR